MLEICPGYSFGVLSVVSVAEGKQEEKASQDKGKQGSAAGANQESKNKGFPGGGKFGERFKKESGKKKPEGFRLEMVVDPKNPWFLAAVAAAVGIAGYALYESYSYREITWQEFYNSYLSKNMVSRFTVYTFNIFLQLVLLTCCCHMFPGLVSSLLFF